MSEKRSAEKKPVSMAMQVLEEAREKIIERCKQDLAEIDFAIAGLKSLPGGWKGMRMPEAVHAYLSNFSEPVPFTDLMRALERGGVELGDPQKPQRYHANVKTTVMNNRKRFRYDKTKDTVILVREEQASL
jgi:hypothetical protein